ncbi:MAG: hypothetical protein V1819_01385 [bacterium]
MKKINKFVCCLVILSLFLQFAPSSKPAQAFSVSDIGAWLKKLVSKASLPEIILNEQGDLNLGGFTLFDCIGGKDAKGVCVNQSNPFSRIKLKWDGQEVKSQIPLVVTQDYDPNYIDRQLQALKNLPIPKDQIEALQAKIVQADEKAKDFKKGDLTMPRPYLMPECELSIPLPGDDKCQGSLDCERKKLAKNKACVSLDRLQDSAAEEVYLAYKIFNATDPFSDCLFVKNCRTNCSLRLGEIKFSVTLLDVAALFVPGGFLTVVQKILNIAKIINEALKIYTAIKETLQSGLNFLSDLFNVVSQVSSMFASFTNLGLKWSDALIYGGGALASNYLGKEIQDIGVDKGGNIGWLINKGGSALTVGDGLLGGVTATAVLNTDRAKQATNAMQDMLANFAQNNLKFNTAKTEALKANEKMRNDVEKERSSFKAEPEIAFLFNPNYKDNRGISSEGFRQMLDNASLAFESVSAFLGQISNATNLKDGQSVNNLLTWKLGDSVNFCSENAPKDSIIRDECPIEQLDVYCTTTPWLLDLDLAGPSQLFNGVDYKCFLPARAIPTDTVSTYPYSSCWFDNFKMMASNIGPLVSFLKYIDPDYIKKQLVGCDDLLCFEDGKCNSSFNQHSDCSVANLGTQDSGMECYGEKGDCNIDISNDTGARWRAYWENLAEVVGTVENIRAVYALIKNATPENKVKLCGSSSCDNALNSLKDSLTKLYTYQGKATDIQILLKDPIKEFRFKNLKEYSFTVFDNAENATTKISMEERHNFFVGRLLVLFPSFSILNALETYISSPATDKGWSDTRTKINDTIASFQQAVANNYDYFNIIFDGLSEIESNLVTCVDMLPSAPLPNSSDRKMFFTEPYFGSYESIPPMSSWIGRLERSYEKDVAYEDWDSKIEVIESNKNKFEDVKQALLLKVSPQSPIVVYKIAKVQDYLKDVKTEAQKLAGGDLKNFESLANQIIDAIVKSIEETCLTPNQTAFNNYGNCCQEKSVLTNKSCCRTPVYSSAEIYGNKGITCGNGWTSATAALNRLSVSACNQCKEQCKSCAAACEAPYTECLVGAVNNSQAKATEQAFSMCGESWQCYNDIYNSLYNTFYAGYSGGCATEKETCEIDCVGGFTLNQKCLDDCNSTTGACGRINSLQSQVDCFDANAKAYKDGYDQYYQCKKDIDELNGQRGNLSKAITGLADTLNSASEDLKNAFNEMQRNWAKPFPETSPENQESQMARATIEKVTGLKESAKNVLNITAYIESKLWDLTEKPNNPLSIIQKIFNMAKDRKTIKSEIKTSLQKISDDFQSANKETGAIPALRDTIDNYIYKTLGPKGLEKNYYCSIGSCNGEGGKTFLCALKCFEKDNNRSFEQLISFTEVLRNIENAAYGLGQAKQGIGAIEPSLEMEPVTIKPNLLDEAEEKAQCCNKPGCPQKDRNDCSFDKLSTKFNEKTKELDLVKTPGSCSTWITEKCNQKSTMYSGQRTGEANYGFFKDKILANPLGTLEEKFNAISTAINNYLMPAMEGSQSFISSNDVFGSDNARKQAYIATSTDVLKQARYLWWDLIWGNTDVSQELLSACTTTESILTSDPADIESKCRNRLTEKDSNETFIHTNLLKENNPAGYDNLKSQCQILFEVDLDVLDNLKDNSKYIDERLGAIKDMRAKISAAVICPDWFCLNPETGTWGAGMNKVDPYCKEVNDLYCQKFPDPSKGAILCDKDSQAPNDKKEGAREITPNIVWSVNYNIVGPPTPTALVEDRFKQWPPAGEPNYLGIQNMCVQTQGEILNLKKLQALINTLGGSDKLASLADQCNQLSYQEDFASDCYNFDVLKKVWNNQTIAPINEDDTRVARKAINGFCRAKADGKVITETIKPDTSIGDFFGCSGGNVKVDLTASTQDAIDAREAAVKLCFQATSDMRTPLNEIMKVFSVLLGVKSYTAAKNGLGALYVDAQKVRQRTEDVINLIREAPKKFGDLWGSDDKISKISKANFDVTLVKCISGPMISYAGSGKALTGPKGGQVCPNVGEQFGQLDAMFSQVRQNLRMIDLARQKPSSTFGFFEGDNGDKRLKIAIPKASEIDENLNELVQPIYDRAEAIKEKSQLLWALASAINFANENCTCGQSYCPTFSKIPLCISGLPLTWEPLKQPFCHLIWTMRYPLGSLAKTLAEQLESETIR